MNLAQDFSPGTALSANDLVPEARLSPCSTDQFAASHTWVFTQSLKCREYPCTRLLVA